MGIQMPENVVQYILSEQTLWSGQCKRRIVICIVIIEA